jgi:hypothetical protein
VHFGDPFQLVRMRSSTENKDAGRIGMDYQQSCLLGRILFPGWMFGKQGRQFRNPR